MPGTQPDGPPLAEYFQVNNADANLTHVPLGVSNQSACYCSDMMSTGFGGAEGAEKANIPAGGTVAVFGVGPVGIMAVAGARLRAAGLIIAVDKIPMRLGFPREYGADVTINFALTDPIEEIMKIPMGSSSTPPLNASAIRTRS